MEAHERSEKCKEVFSLLSEYLDLELPRMPAKKWKLTFPAVRHAWN